MASKFHKMKFLFHYSKCRSIGWFTPKAKKERSLRLESRVTSIIKAHYMLRRQWRFYTEQIWTSTPSKKGVKILQSKMAFWHIGIITLSPFPRGVSAPIMCGETWIRTWRRGISSQLSFLTRNGKNYIFCRHMFTDIHLISINTCHQSLHFSFHSKWIECSTIECSTVPLFTHIFKNINQKCRWQKSSFCKVIRITFTLTIEYTQYERETTFTA